MTNLQKSTVDNLGALQRKIYFAPLSFIESIGEIAEPEITEAVNFKDGYDWLFIECTQNDAGFSEDPKDSDAGEVHEVRIKVFFPADTPAIRKQLFEYSQHHHIVLAIDNNGVARLCGTLINPMRFSYKYSTGSKISSLNGYELEWTGRFDMPVPVYNV